jgi:DNA-binding NarL/FixJ family response regulator
MSRVFSPAAMPLCAKRFGLPSRPEVCGEATNGIKGIKEVMELLPDLVILEKGLSPLDGFEVAEALKLILPDVHFFWSRSNTTWRPRRKLCLTE